jgi:hypothetical protein
VLTLLPFGSPDRTRTCPDLSGPRHRKNPCTCKAKSPIERPAQDVWRCPGSATQLHATGLTSGLRYAGARESRTRQAAFDFQGSDRLLLWARRPGLAHTQGHGRSIGTGFRRREWRTALSLLPHVERPFPSNAGSHQGWPRPRPRVAFHLRSLQDDAARQTSCGKPKAAEGGVGASS